MMNINTLSAPASIVETLKTLSNSIHFEKQSNYGSNGWLFFGKNKINKMKVAVKFYDWDNKSSYHTEPKYLAEIDNPNVIKILDAKFVNDKYAFFLTPYYNKGDLDNEILRGIKGNLRAVSLVCDIIKGLSALHSKKLIHRDLKPQNIFVSDSGSALIGDFGSVKRLPNNVETIPGSGHSLIYRPPESIISNEYGKVGDIYQIGIVFFQLLGGYFPYNEQDWLSKSERKTYKKLENMIDKQIYANDRIKEKIKKGKIINTKSLPDWVCLPLKKMINKACNLDPQKRFSSCSEFLTAIHNLKPKIKNWYFEDNVVCLDSNSKYKIQFDNKLNTFYTEKKKNIMWRKISSLTCDNLTKLIKKIESDDK